jgi:hypothetical protein
VVVIQVLLLRELLDKEMRVGLVLIVEIILAAVAAAQVLLGKVHLALAAMAVMEQHQA